MRRAWVLILLIATTLANSCGESVRTPPESASPNELAEMFAEAMVSEDREGVQALLCGDIPGPGDQDLMYPWENARVTGAPNDEPDADAFVIHDPAPDLFVPIEAMENGKTVTGTINVYFDDSKRCVTNFGLSRAREEGDPF